MICSILFNDLSEGKRPSMSKAFLPIILTFHINCLFAAPHIEYGLSQYDYRKAPAQPHVAL